MLGWVFAPQAQSTVALFKKIEAKHRKARIIYIYCDNARYYRSRLVEEFLKTSRIVVIFLPAYSPNLNLIERLWKYFRKEILYNEYYEKFSDFQTACHTFFDNIKEHKKALRSLLTENFQIIGMWHRFFVLDGYNKNMLANRAGFLSQFETAVVSSSEAVPCMDFSITFLVCSAALQWSHWPLTSTILRMFLPFLN